MRKLSFRKRNSVENLNKDVLYKDLFSNYPDALFLLDYKGEFIDINDDLASLTGFSKETLLYSHFSNYIHANDLDLVKNAFTNALKGNANEKEFRMIHKSKTIKFVSVKVGPAMINGEVLGIYGVAKDITEIKMLENELRKSEVLFETLIQQSADVIAKLDRSGIIQYVSPAVKQVLGYEAKEQIGKSCLDWVYEGDLKIAQNVIQSVLNDPQSKIKAEFRLKKVDGSSLYCEVSVMNLLDDENVNGIIVNYRDISSRKKSEEEMKQLAYYDYLTGLPNRFLLEKCLLEELEKGQPSAILFIDLDRFKVINDSMSHHVGDLLLIEVTKRLKSCLAESDYLFRQGGDEFVIVLTNVDRNLASNISDKIVQLFASPFFVNNFDVYTSPSIGISMLPEDGTSVEQLTKNADFAMYQAKNNGGNGVSFYSPPDVGDSINPLKLEMELHSAVDRNELVLHYQPKVNLKTGEIIGVEALIRWLHPEWGMISPGTFIPIAEESGLIIPIGEWALKEACKQNKKWQRNGFKCVMSVNLSPRQFTKVNLVQTIKRILEETDLQPYFLELEITESMTVNIDQTITTLHEFKKLGVKISIDDFGTGFSSLNYLKQFPIDTLKIDQSFVRELFDDTSDATIVKTIISMAHNLKLNVVAEGIETKEQLVFLQQHLCNEGQGYLFSKPVPASELEKRIPEITQIVNEQGVTLNNNERIWTEEFNVITKNDAENPQQDFIFKFKKVDDRFIHTFSKGELFPSNTIGKELREFLPEKIAAEKVHYYERAWNGEQVTYKAILNGFYYIATLKPIKYQGQVTEVIGTCMDLSRLEFDQSSYPETRYGLLAENVTELIDDCVEGMIVTENRRDKDFHWKAEKLQLVSELAASIAHEIRNPVTSIKGFVHLLEQGMLKQNYFDVIRSSIHQIEKYIEEFLNISKPPINQKDAVDIDMLLQDVKSSLAHLAKEKRVEIYLEEAADFPQVKCDPVQIKQVFMNLVTNSIEASQNGGLIKLRVSNSGSNLLIKVVDHGVGMKEERLGRLGEPFFSIKEKGTGLGLMLCHRIIWQHNGTISIASEENKGTTVVVRLPGLDIN
ncbi:EAL domain-containing protein [Alkalihalobacillus deserti]|uniref:EAL domain-containing protein n=1 Tax=Alkalihalobacillus deserti TaxID=2879466 RepID=UPI001D15AAEC|nr:EAL domain-containing protein [Alkalihalobacillus deserti]